jgi:hypothetical protein
MNETFYVLTVEGGIHADLHGPFPTATKTLAAWTTLHGAQDPETDQAFVLAVKADTGELVLV